ncbi:hypothetical protein HDE_00916 [Halotydeus destructor]|nr:hypothetical protein HDE_00916 [Halotydeus destructor]
MLRYSRSYITCRNPSSGLDDIENLNCSLTIKRTIPLMTQLKITLLGAVFVSFDDFDRVDVNIQTTGSDFGRNFNIKFEPVFNNTPNSAPTGCQKYLKAEDGDFIYRSLNYQFGSMTRVALVSCFDSGDPARPLKSITLTPKAIGREDAFRLGTLQGAQQEDACTNFDRLELSSPSSNGRVTPFCGSHFNESPGATTDGSVTVKATNGLVRVTFMPSSLPAGASGRSGHRVVKGSTGEIARVDLPPYVPIIFRFSVKYQL